MLYSACVSPHQRHLLVPAFDSSQLPIAPSYAAKGVSAGHCVGDRAGIRAPAASSVLHHSFPDPTYLTGAA